MFEELSGNLYLLIVYIVLTLISRYWQYKSVFHSPSLMLQIIFAKYINYKNIYLEETFYFKTIIFCHQDYIILGYKILNKKLDLSTRLMVVFVALYLSSITLHSHVKFCLVSYM